MNYQAFKDYVVPYLWKKGDQQLIDNLDNLIIQGEAKLNRDIRDELRHNSVELTLTANMMPLPDDYRSLRNVTDTGTQLGELEYTTPAEIRGERVRRPNTWLPYYSLEGNNLMFTEGWDGNKVTVDYNRRISGYAVNDMNWFQEAEPDIFLHAVLMQTAPFLREDERIPVWQAYYNENVTLLNDESAHDRQRGVYGDMPLPRNASGRKPRNARGANSYKLHTRA